MSISDDEIEHLYDRVHAECESVEQALDLIEHERLDASALNYLRGYETMADPNSRIDVDHDKRGEPLDREVTLFVRGGGYTYRKPCFAVSGSSVALMMSVAEAREMADKLLAAIGAAEEKVS
jgi:predicted RNase H-related nuclease YkuK (DUF458 family)